MFARCRFCAEATFRINILEQRLERQEALVTKKYQELEQRLANDPRLAIIHNPAALAARNAKAAGATAAKSVEPTAGTRKPGAPARTGR
ncbi:hypothetical protein EON66_09045 [archaeon]|nr:MAG: hypothetical protein EON66_09045 [archaeon]